jgi:hypothetical protein
MHAIYARLVCTPYMYALYVCRTAAVGTKVRSISDGRVHAFGYNPGLGDYGYVVVVRD